ncbi:aromatic amino acid transaminase [Ketogulonicigenium vulgare]|uniref:Aminotransferase, classes I and II superfamily protein n=1 Tax=Ketogulonicigenium vulgare (strain WSH-001) TaxID=759362 RepID=F9Y7T9_KETVW|nr:amino acid aminotransferase [Ketogulonicigenium vulgare]ADO41666.1 aromatic amino acid aminotransferase [Ketogulonicigenium vulgare Y25]AEM39905.1 Aminotransferase, classes I and II superfamily protein [Ketogulonicigenium vulgare WSH-001]ALJ80121.1 aromatic amino acid aminotransferase [Ketogulonicigenium vulgare]ANW32989.1 aromatic amino acid aminotransferase [Ketogulonicigenium vulgare]AOZ53598.1 aromatic amino acid aminotransferase [Ketogulonicigenium vulgare]
MLEHLKEQPADKILSLTTAYRADPRPNKVDLGVGVYKDAEGHTPVMRAVKEAERRLVASQDTKVYTALSGDQVFIDAMVDLVLDGAVARGRVAGIATPGGTGAIRQALELIKLAAPSAKIWVSNPSWPNHASIINYLGMTRQDYRYFDEETRGLDFDGMIADLKTVAAGDVVLLHGCCHNPTGANPTADQWAVIIETVKAAGAVPLVDIAYQGFGDGLDEDAAATRAVAAAFPECLIAASCSKNFGIYRERTGILMAISDEAARTGITQGTLNFLNRQNYSFPPDHGARVVGMILTDPALRADWQAELEEVRLGMLGLRKQLADELRRLTNSDRFDFIAHHRGMFSRIGASPAQVEAMRADDAIYMVGDSRMNIAGLNARTIPLLAAAIVKAGA